LAKLILNGSTSGSISLESPAVSGTTTLTLPTTSGTVLTNGTNTNFPAGSVLQVVSTTKTDTFSSSSSSWNDITGLSVSITPTSSSNKILIIYNLMSGETASQFPMIRLVRDSTAISIGASSGSRTQVSSVAWGSGSNNTSNMQSMNFLDSPSTTSSTTYKLQTIATFSELVYINRVARDDNASYEPRGVSSITVMEIKG
jgi:hypothetical protein